MHVNSWQRVQALRRLLLILVAVSLIGLTVVVLRSPETIDRISNAIMGQTGNQASAATPQLAEEPPEKPVKKNLKRVRNPLNPPELLLESSQPDTVQVLPSQEVRRIIRRGPVQANGKTDSAAVYSSNSSRSSIVHVLKHVRRINGVEGCVWKGMRLQRSLARVEAQRPRVCDGDRVSFDAHNIPATYPSKSDPMSPE